MSNQHGPDIGEIGQRILTRRGHLRLDQDDVAERAGLSRAYISRLERALVPNPKLGDLAQIASALDMPLVDLVRQPPGTRTEAYATEAAALGAQLADEPPEVAELILRWWRELVEIERLRRLAREN